jgi:hypothetical protein
MFASAACQSRKAEENMIRFWYSGTSKRAYDPEVEGSECVEVSAEFIRDLIAQNTPTDARLREYVSYENMRKLFFEHSLPFEVIASDVIHLLKWTSNDFTSYTGLRRDTYFRIKKRKKRDWDAETVRGFCNGAPIGPLLAIYLLGKAGMTINPWVDAVNFEPPTSMRRTYY